MGEQWEQCKWERESLMSRVVDRSDARGLELSWRVGRVEEEECKGEG